MKNITIGFIGQGFVGKNYADDFENRGYTVVRYSQEEPYSDNKDKIKDCDIVFIAVPTPTTPKGYDGHIIQEVVPLTSPRSIIVLKSTILPGFTKTLQNKFPDRIILHSPEFLSEKTAKYDAANPFENIVGIPKDTLKYKKAAKLVLSILPKAPYSSIVSSEEAELIKYCHNCSGYTQIIFFNLMYNLTQNFKADWSHIEKAVKADPFIPNRYASPMHKNGRGAGGHCFIKDMAAFREIYEKKHG